MSGLTDTEREALDCALGVILARVRCALIHNQINGGRCVHCISWAKRIGAPEHMPRLAPGVERIKANAIEQGRADLAAKVEPLADEHARHIARYATQYDGRGGVSHYDHGGLWCGCGEWDSGPTTGPRPWADWHAHVVRAILAADSTPTETCDCYPLGGTWPGCPVHGAAADPTPTEARQ